MSPVSQDLCISCHAPGQDVSWVEGNGNAVCSLCGSIHPEEFIRLIREGEFITGFMWEGGNAPICAYVGGYRFFVVHLVDMPVEWLYDNALLIFEMTGVLFYWKKETLMFQTEIPGLNLGKGSAYVITPKQLTRARRLNEKYYLAEKQQ